MNTEKFEFRVKAPRQRKHRVLFEKDSPFKGKVHDDKHAYKRKPKFHPSFDDLYED